MWRNQLALGVVVSFVTACSTNYVPRSPGRVSVTLQGGVQTYVRDGQTYPHGFLGSGLVRAVAGVPQAERAAREYRGRLRDGLLLMIGGTVCAATAVGLAARHIDAYDDETGGDGSTELLVALGCTVAILGGSLYAASAEPYRWDALNIFNDAAVTPPVFVPYGPPGAARTPVLRKTISLGMR